jgi:hypothetical protein
MGLVLAWLAGEGIVTYRWVKAGAPPTPGALLQVSGFFALLALLHEIPPARTTATLLAVGIDIAALLQVLGKAPASQATGWPPLPINDPAVLLPAGGKGGKIAQEGAPVVNTPSSSGSSSPGFLTWLGELSKGGI